MKWFLPLLVALPVMDDEVFVVEPREITWDQLSPGQFDLAYRLPTQRREKSQDLVQDMRELVALRFELKDASGKVYRTVGDLAVASRTMRGDAFEDWLEDLAKRHPALFRRWGEAFEQLLGNEDLVSTKWKPKKDRDRDGILLGEPWDLAAENVAPWNDLEVDPQVEQAAILVFAETSSIKAVENDYSTYPDDIGADYEAIYPYDAGHVRGTDAEGRPFSAVRLYFRCDLPFIYSDYECDLRILNAVDPDGLLVTDIYSKSKDFHWLAGRDHFLPVLDGEGKRVAQLMVRLYGFDIDDVPDKAKHRRTALRGSLGNLRRKAEALQDILDARTRALPEGVTVPDPPVVPKFIVRGTR